VRAAFRSFQVPSSGDLSVAVKLLADTTYAAQPKRAAVDLEHDIADPTMMVVLGIFLLAGGWICAAVGCVLLLGPNLPSFDTSELATLTVAQRRRAALCHLVGFSGLLLPLVGNVLGPLLAWIVLRKQHPYIDHQGREAINFQLSILAYMVLSFWLILILIGAFLVPALWLFQLIMVVVAAHRAHNGELFRYPLTLRFIH